MKIVEGVIVAFIRGKTLGEDAGINLNLEGNKCLSLVRKAFNHSKA